jgi:hypothetical protein
MAGRKKQSTEAAVREIRRRTRRKFAPEEKIRIVLEGLRGEHEARSTARLELVRQRLAGADDPRRTLDERSARAPAVRLRPVAIPTRPSARRSAVEGSGIGTT